LGPAFLRRRSLLQPGRSASIIWSREGMKLEVAADNQWMAAVVARLKLVW
jgi:hypothetical protein